MYIQGGVKKSVTYAKVIWNKINLLVTHKCVVLLLRHLHSHQIRNKSTWWALLVLWSYNWRSHAPCHMPQCPLQPHSLQSKVGGIKFVLGRWVPQRLSCYKHFYCLVYQHTPFDPLPPGRQPFWNRLSTSFAIIITHLWATNLVRPQRTFSRTYAASI